MNITIFKIFARYASLLIVSLSSMFNSVSIQTNFIGINNNDKNKSSSVVNTIINYNTITEYDAKIPSGLENVVSQGQDGIVYLDASGNVFKTVQQKIDKVVKVGIGKYGQYTGTITAYGPDCATCDGKGYVSCPTKSGGTYNLLKDGVYYNDSEYGNIRILAADQREFPCGTIVKVTNSEYKDSFIGIVMDTGYAMKKDYDNGIIHFDLAFASEANIQFATNTNTSFSVQRWGW